VKNRRNIATDIDKRRYSFGIVRLRIVVDIIVPFVPSNAALMLMCRTRARSRGRRIIITLVILEGRRVSERLALRIAINALACRRIQHAFVRRHADASATPLIRLGVPLGRRFLVVVKVVRVLAPHAGQPTDQPAPVQVLGVDNAALAELDALARVVNPGEVDHQGCLYGAKDPARRVAVSLLCGAAHNPVQDVEEAVGAEGDEVVRIDDGGDSGLAEEKQLRNDADGFEYLGEDPEELAC
jgi:hypothetical protein